MVWKNDQVSELETKKVLELAQKQINVFGDYVEFGCYKGDTSLCLAEILQGTNKKLWIYDSFEGLPAKSKFDESVMGENFKSGELYVTKREVKERFLKAGLLVPIIKKAWFNELKSEDLPEKIAFAFVDGDFYESIKDSLRLVGEKITQNGVIIVHDYGNLALPGVAKAVQEWIQNKDLKIDLFETMAIISGF